MSYKDREQYLGYSTKIGYLDKGGKWRKKDWWTHSNQDKKNQKDAFEKEKQEAKKKDEALLNFKLKEQGLPCINSKFNSILGECQSLSQVL